MPDVVLLILFCSAPKKNHNLIALFAKVHAVARAKIDLVFKNARSNTLNVREVTLPYAIQGGGHLPRGFRIQPVEPRPKRAATGVIAVLTDVNHHSDGTIYFTIAKDICIWFGLPSLKRNLLTQGEYKAKLSKMG